MKPLSSSVILLTGLLFFSNPEARAQRSQREQIPYDTSTLTSMQGPYAMPYNRWIDPAGTVVRFGDPKLENHSLDAILLPGDEFLAVEDRYGIIVFRAADHSVMARLSFAGNKKYGNLMSTYSGIKAIRYQGATHLFWGAGHGSNADSYVMEAVWKGEDLDFVQAIPFPAKAPAPMALPNEVIAREENGALYLYVVLNGTNQLEKIRVRDQAVSWVVPVGVAPYGVTMAGGKLFVSNWAGPVPTDTTGKETAGVPWGSAYTDPRTGATSRGTVSVLEPGSGRIIKEIEVGLHPSAIIHSPDEQTIFVANGNSDNVSVIRSSTLEVVDTIAISPFEQGSGYMGSTPCALAINAAADRLYVANGMNNAIAVIELKTQKPQVLGFIPTEAWPSGIVCSKGMLYVTNLEAIGSRSMNNGAYNSHWQQASVSWIPVPDAAQLEKYTARVRGLNLTFREAMARQLPRPGTAPLPVPERIGEPSVFRHVVYIIKENRTYDQVLGDMKEGKGEPSLCVFGDSVTPNEHQLAKEFHLLDNFYASGKCSAEGHQWADAAMVTDYVERMVRAWFRSYPHAQYDAMVYDKEGFIWNNALDHGKTVRIYGEACTTTIDKSLTWQQLYQLHQNGQPFDAHNVSTISRVRPILSAEYPGYDDMRISDQLRADAFIKEMKEYEVKPGDQWPELMVLSLPNDHTTGTSPGYPTPRAMVADNDLALGRIIEAITHSRFWNSTAIFVTEDDSQAGWDHISAYRTTGFVISPWSRLKRTVSTNYNQTSLIRTIEQILGIPPMNAMDGTALPMFECFTDKRDTTAFTVIPNRIPLTEMNHSLAELKGKARKYAKLSLENKAEEVDEGDDDTFNRILWWVTKGPVPYPAAPKENRQPLPAGSE